MLCNSSSSFICYMHMWSVNVKYAHWKSFAIGVCDELQDPGKLALFSNRFFREAAMNPVHLC